MSKTFKATFKYADDTTRIYDLEVDDSLAAGVKQNVINFNASLAGGTAGGLSTFFVSDGGENLLMISEAKLISTITTPVSIGGGA